jgi:hypothetical protein
MVMNSQDSMNYSLKYSVNKWECLCDISVLSTLNELNKLKASLSYVARAWSKTWKKERLNCRDLGEQRRVQRVEVGIEMEKTLLWITRIRKQRSYSWLVGLENIILWKQICTFIYLIRIVKSFNTLEWQEHVKIKLVENLKTKSTSLVNVIISHLWR